MCLLFACVDPNCSQDGFKLILVSVRDEFCHRPTIKCDWWPNDLHIIGGMDMEPGREGGTWLAMDKSTGNVGVLLNILQPYGTAKSDLKNRGGLVKEFLTGSDDGKTYLEKLRTNAKQYSPFQMVTIELKNQDKHVTTLSSDSDAEPKINGPGVYGFGNNGSGAPWKKLTYGQEQFQKIIDKFPKSSDKEALVESLFEMLRDKTKNLPDEQLQKQAQGHIQEAVEGLSSICVSIPQYNYGSRTNSIILVDGNDHVIFMEKTLKEDCKIDNLEWEFSKFEFDIHA